MPQKKKTTPRKVAGGFPWDRMSREPARAWEAFQLYRDMRYHNPSKTQKNKGRSQAELARRQEISTTTIESYAKKWKWTSRVDAYDEWIDKKFLQPAVVDKALKIQEEQLLSAKALRSVGLKMLQKVNTHLDTAKKEDQISMDKLIIAMERLVTASVKIEQAALGKTTLAEGNEGGDVNFNTQVNVDNRSVIVLPDNNRDPR